jgi:transcriptional regulator with XRE-family HTH domain
MMFEQNAVGVLGDRAALRELGARLRDCRLRRNVTQRLIADAMGVSLPTYRKLEQGNGTVPMRHLAKALALFGTVDRLPDVIVPNLTSMETSYPPQRRLRARPRNDAAPAFSFV